MLGVGVLIQCHQAYHCCIYTFDVKVPDLKLRLLMYVLGPPAMSGGWVAAGLVLIHGGIWNVLH